MFINNNTQCQLVKLLDFNASLFSWSGHKETLSGIVIMIKWIFWMQITLDRPVGLSVCQWGASLAMVIFQHAAACLSYILMAII